MPVNIGDKGQADFTQPIELLMDCHRRIERFLTILQKVSQCKELDAEHREALHTSLDYFNLAGPRHNQDEEASLFPALISSGKAPVVASLDRLQQLADEHTTTESLHHRIAILGEAWLSAGHITDVNLTELRSLIEQLIAIYTPHIAMEEREIFPLASKALSAGELARIGEQMRARRAVNPGREGSRCSQRRRQSNL
jgi:hemerythrin-like domain-containing protein